MSLIEQKRPHLEDPRFWTVIVPLYSPSEEPTPEQVRWMMVNALGWLPGMPERIIKADYSIETLLGKPVFVARMPKLIGDPKGDPRDSASQAEGEIKKVLGA